MVARNDDYCMGFMHRLQVSVNTLLKQFRRLERDAELILVEWNPPPDRPRLQDVLSLPACLGAGSLRIIEVPSRIHRTLPNSELMPVFEFIGKNVGIRRARGEFVVATNADILLSGPLVRFMTSRRPSGDCFYRVDRYDVSAAIPLGLSPAKALSLCRRSYSRIATRRRFVAIADRRSRKLHELRSLVVPSRRPVCQRGEIVKSWRGLHSRASGDFLMMAQSAWSGIQGYYELPTHGHIDTYACGMSACSGIRQVVLGGEMRIYHQDHSRDEHAKRPPTDLATVSDSCQRMLAARQPEFANTKDWGLATHTLSECHTGK